MTTKLRTLILTALLTATTVSASGCAIFSFLVATMVPKPKTPALFTLPAEQTVLVFPDDVVRQLAHAPAKRVLAERLSAELLGRKLVTNAVSYDQLLTLLTGQTQPAPVPIDTVTERLGADMSVYIDIRDFRLKESPADLVWKARMTAMVRVVAASGHELWPNDGTAGFEVTTEMPMMTNESDTFGDRLADELVAATADKIAKLFYEHREN